MAKRTTAPFSLAGNEFRFSLNLPVTSTRAWAALVKDVNKWWPADFFAVGSGSKMSFDLRLGGGLIEKGRGNNGVTWYSIIALDEPRSLTMTGFIAPPFGGPATTMMRLSVESAGEGKSVLEVQSSQFGQIGDCDVESGWKTIFKSFQQHVSGKKK